MPKQPEDWQIRDIAHPKGYTVTASNFMQQAVKGLGITSGSEHDLNAFRGTALNLHGAEIFADKAYIDRLEQEMPAQGKQVKLYTPVKKKKKQKQLFLFDQLLSAAANKIRQNPSAH